MKSSASGPLDSHALEKRVSRISKSILNFGLFLVRYRLHWAVSDSFSVNAHLSLKMGILHIVFGIVTLTLKARKRNERCYLNQEWKYFVNFCELLVHFYSSYLAHLDAFLRPNIFWTKNVLTCPDTFWRFFSKLSISTLSY